jgi:hypothetical protein
MDDGTNTKKKGTSALGLLGLTALAVGAVAAFRWVLALLGCGT